MIDKLKVTLVQFEPVPKNNKKKNLEFHLNKIDELASTGIQLIVFPEMSLTGFFVHQQNERKRHWEEDAETIKGEMIQAIVNKSKINNCYVVCGMAERDEREFDIYNSTILIGPEGVIGVTRKLHLPSAEKLYYKKGDVGEVYSTPIGKIGMLICYEAFFPEVSRILAKRGAEILIAPSSIWKGGQSGGIGAGESKQRLFSNTPLIRAIENQAHFLMCNAAGGQFLGEAFGRWERFGESKIVNAQGEVLAESLSNDTEDITAILTKTSLLKSRSDYMFFNDREPMKYGDLVK
ncbi:carbon-nitrogen hydrolase family protein [Sporosarcina sp. FSL K6-1508]|uniref:carbon-nitrogen hydrolase family protein n=1 Tax=Sporosarcina sp. FSL K6-1508 TaxID=2921553 RepID=UPI0030F55544